MTVTFWGVRGSIPTPGDATRRYGGNTSCVEIRTPEALLVCDAGSGLRPMGLDLKGRDPGALEIHLFLTHAHWDHIQGFPFFDAAYSPDNKILVYGTESGDDRNYQLLSGQMQGGYFPVPFLSLRASVGPAYMPGGRVRVGDVEVEAFPLHHPGGCFGYVFESGGRKIVYATDHHICWDGGPEEPRSVPRAYLDVARDADLLIADAQYTDAEYLSRPDWGHSSALTVTDWALQAGVKQLALFHHDPSHSDGDMDMMVAECAARVRRQNGGLRVFAAEEGKSLVFPQG